MVAFLLNFILFWFMCIHFSIFQLVGETGLSSRKWSINRFRGWGGIMGFEGGWVGDMIQIQTSPNW